MQCGCYMHLVDTFVQTYILYKHMGATLGFSVHFKDPLI